MRNKTRENIIFLVGTCCYTGYSHIAPGSVATLVAGIPLFLILGKLPLPFYFLACMGIFIVGCKVSDEIEKISGEKDPSKIVIDELLGFLVTMAGFLPGFTTIIPGFILFRIFDIIKPWPIRTIEKNLPGGLGVMMDDVAAGIYAGIFVRFFIYFFS